VDGIHDVNSNEQLQVYATGAICRSWTEEVERKKRFQYRKLFWRRIANLLCANYLCYFRNLFVQNLLI